jgi:OmpA-OmpF porin, OOP family
MKRLLSFTLALAVLSIFSTHAQITNPLDKAKDKSTDRVNNNVDKGIDKGLDKVEGVFKKKDKNKDKQTSSDSTSTNTNNSGSSTNTDNTSSTTKIDTFKSYSKYDFIPGEKVIYYEDFSQDPIGDFPTLWNTNGTAEVSTTNMYPGHWAKFSMGNKSMWTDSLLKLPDNYTIEFDVIPINGDENRMAGFDFRLIQSINTNSFDWGAIPGKAGFLFNVEYYGRPSYRTYINEDGGENMGLTGNIDNESYYEKVNQKYHIAIWVQKSRIRLYQDENKLIDLPKAFSLPSVKMDRIRFEEGAVMFSNIRIAVGQPDMRSKLLTEGKLISYGIYFDSGKDIVKGESYGSLKEIAAVLNENPTVKIKIVGHTDSDGDDATNLNLSKNRAIAVKAALNKDFGIDNSRMETDGKGETEPVAPNTTPEGKAKNRRVEFIKL